MKSGLTKLIRIHCRHPASSSVKELKVVMFFINTACRAYVTRIPDINSNFYFFKEGLFSSTQSYTYRNNFEAILTGRIWRGYISMVLFCGRAVLSGIFWRCVSRHISMTQTSHVQLGLLFFANAVSRAERGYIREDIGLKTTNIIQLKDSVNLQLLMWAFSRRLK